MTAMPTSGHEAVGAIAEPVSREDRLCAVLDSGAADIGVLWEFCAYFEWCDRSTTVAGIRHWLGAPNRRRILARRQPRLDAKRNHLPRNSGVDRCHTRLLD